MIRSRLVHAQERLRLCGQSVLRLILSTAITTSSGVVAYLLRFDFHIPDDWLGGALTALVCWSTVQPIGLALTGWHRIGWNRIALRDVGSLIRCVGISAALSTTLILLVQPGAVPRSVFILQAGMVLLCSIVLRIGIRVMQERQDRADAVRPTKRVVIYGAGSAGQALLGELFRKPQIGFLPVGFVDDDASLHGEYIQGLPVLGSGQALGRIVVSEKVDEVLLALPSVRGGRLSEIVTLCDQAGRPCKSIPSLGELIRAPERLTELRQVAPEDLLGRDPVQLDVASIARRVEGRVVLVTGAAGSIGSEICRQLAAFHPSRLLALDIAETPLFNLENEFRESFPESPLVPTIGDVRDEGFLYRVMVQNNVEIVFHAAAYKHVPMMERHVSAAIENNILGTHAVVGASEKAGIAIFVMISTDKAVRPTSVMGATKRFAELIVKSRSGGLTRFVSVRFGNVLGSNGSVVPTFERQIRKGGPVTVTHPEMRRYFMTIPEASQLVLQAMALGTGDEIFVLDMGNPVRISDLARSLIALHGMVPGRDVALQYTGLRPGEKLFEELYLSDENLVRTVHDKILVLKGEGVDRAWIDAQVAVLRKNRFAPDHELRALLAQAIPEYAAAQSPVPDQNSAPTPAPPALRQRENASEKLPDTDLTAWETA
jgi:FlaA1/EpsC-like NDP-sugar epimerase